MWVFVGKKQEVAEPQIYLTPMKSQSLDEEADETIESTKEESSANVAAVSKIKKKDVSKESLKRFRN